MAPPAHHRLTGDALVRAMVAIWNETVRATPLRGQRGTLHADLQEQLLDLVGESTDLDLGDLTIWRSYCRAATQDAHLRGENNGADFADWTGNLEHAIRPRTVRRLTAQLLAAHTRARLDARDALFAIEQAEAIRLAQAEFPDFDPKAAGSPLWQQAVANQSRGDSTLMDMLQVKTFVPSAEELAQLDREQAAKDAATRRILSGRHAGDRPPWQEDPDDGGF